MFPIKIWTIFIAFLIATPVPTANYRKIAEKDMRYSVLLHMRGTQKDKKGNLRQVRAGCSGTYVAPTKILTAAHCFNGYVVEKVWARGPDDALGYPVHILRLDIGLDLALVETAYPHSYAKLGAFPSVGDEVLSIGSPLGFEFVASQGIVSLTGLKIKEFTGTYTVSTAMIDHGSSGGGMFNKKGQLIAVNTLSVGLFQWGGLALAVDVGTIRGFLNGI